MGLIINPSRITMKTGGTPHHTFSFTFLKKVICKLELIVIKQVTRELAMQLMGCRALCIYTHKSYMGVQLPVGHDLGYNAQHVTTSVII
jgi:hypothetical protein